MVESLTAASQEAEKAVHSRHIALLGPQHPTPSLRSVLDEAQMPGPYVLVAAGWEEREAETSALEQHLGEPVQNLGAWPACENAFEQDAVLRDLMFARYDRMRELSRVYRVRMEAELDALRDLLGRTDPAKPDDLVGPSLDLAFDALHRLDEHHCQRVAELNDSTFAAAQLSPSLREGTERMAEQLGSAGTLLIAGGHVGILYNRMRLFRVMENLAPEAAIAGWSAGAMVLTERLLLFHDTPPRGAGNAEIHGPGFGFARGITVLPHASSRLDLEDAARVSILARRMAPDLVAPLDEGESIVCSSDTWECVHKAESGAGKGARRLLPTGEVAPL